MLVAGVKVFSPAHSPCVAFKLPPSLQARTDLIYNVFLVGFEIFQMTSRGLRRSATAPCAPNAGAASAIGAFGTDEDSEEAGDGKEKVLVTVCRRFLAAGARSVSMSEKRQLRHDLTYLGLKEGENIFDNNPFFGADCLNSSRAFPRCP